MKLRFTKALFVTRWLLAISALWVLSDRVATACPFCSAVSQTLRQEMQQMDAVGIAVFVEAESESISIFEIESILKGEKLIQIGQQVRINYFGQPVSGQKFLIMGIDPPDMLWSSPLQMSDKAIDYVREVAQLPADDALERLKFYLKHLSDDDPTLARDVYDEFASSSYADMIKLKDEYDRPWLIDEIKDKSLSPDRRRMYLTMLGICGQPEDADFLEAMLKSSDPDHRFGLDALVACFLNLRGPEGIPLINEMFLSNRESTYADVYAAVNALRVLGNEGKVIERNAIAESLRLMLDRADLADLVIPDLARWEDWSVIDRLAHLFRTADDKSTWVRVPVINYLRACPLPEAATVLDELKELDPAAFRRATQFFPVPQPAGQESSIRRSLPTLRGLASDQPAEISPGVSLASAASMVGANVGGPGVAASTNRFFPATVLLTVCSTIWIAMWLSITGAGKPLS